MTENGFGIVRQTLGQRVLSAIFPQNYLAPAAEESGWAPGELSTDTYAHLSLGDRLRVLVSGKLVVRTRTQTDVIVNNARTRSTISILDPLAKLR